MLLQTNRTVHSVRGFLEHHPWFHLLQVNTRLQLLKHLQILNHHLFPALVVSCQFIEDVSLLHLSHSTPYLVVEPLIKIAHLVLSPTLHFKLQSKKKTYCFTRGSCSLLTVHSSLITSSQGYFNHHTLAYLVAHHQHSNFQHEHFSKYSSAHFTQSVHALQSCQLCLLFHVPFQYQSFCCRYLCPQYRTYGIFSSIFLGYGTLPHSSAIVCLDSWQELG